MKNPHDIVKGLLRTEKGANIMPLNKYLFWVAKDSNKIEIKKSVEDIYKVKVEGVNTIMMRRKEEEDGDDVSGASGTGGL